MSAGCRSAAAASGTSGPTRAANLAPSTASSGAPGRRPTPCHCLFQFFVADGKLSCQRYQRSADVFLGVPFNIASYALLTMMMAKVTGLEPGEFVHTLGDAHLYLNHLDQAREQLTREPYPFPTLTLADKRDLTAFEYEDFKVTGYKAHEKIAAPIAV